MDYNYEPLLDLNCNYQRKLLEFNRLSEDLRDRLNNIFKKNILNASEKENLLIQDFESIINRNAEKLNSTFTMDYNELVKLKKYFFGCPADIYQNTYKLRLSHFLITFPDANEIGFINNELDKGILITEYEIYGDIEQNIYYSLERRFDFLNKRANELGFDIIHKDKTSREYNIKKNKQIRNHEIISPMNKNNSHESIFENGAFDIFQKWMNTNINEDPKKKISFIFQKLKNENQIRNSNFKDILNWLEANNYLDKEIIIPFREDGYFISPSKILTKSRIAIYNSIIAN